MAACSAFAGFRSGKRVGSALSLIALAMGLVVSCDGRSLSATFKLPDGYKGWVAIIEDEPSCPQLEVKDDAYTVVIGPNGKACFSNRLPSDVWEKVRYVTLSGTPIPESRILRAGGHGVAWDHGWELVSVEFCVGEERNCSGSALSNSHPPGLGWHPERPHKARSYFGCGGG